MKGQLVVRCAVSAAGLLLGLQQGARAAESHVAFAQPGRGQPGLAVGFDASGALRAALCAAPDCSLEHGLRIELPEEFGGQIAGARLSVVGIGGERRAVLATLGDPEHARGFQALFAAPLKGSEPLVLFSGLAGFVSGEDGLRHGPLVQISEPDEQGARRVLVGEVAEDVSLCGRPTILEPRLLDERDLALHPARVQRLTTAERARAREVSAVRAEDAKLEGHGLLHAVAASSAIGSPFALTDGNPESTWAEDRGGSGRGEFVVMNAPPELALSGVELSIRPAQSSPEHGAAPRDFWLATHHELLHVTMPEDAWKTPGARYRVAFDPPLRDDCLALVVGGAFDSRENARVTFAEIGATTELDGLALPELVARLSGGGQRAEAAEALLRALGPPAVEAIERGYAALDEAGALAALDVLEQAPCLRASELYVAALGDSERLRERARERLFHCGSQAVEALSKALPNASDALARELLEPLVQASPARAVDAIVPLLDTDAAARRRLLRVALARAAGGAPAHPHISAALVDSALAPRARIEILRALGDRLVEFEPEAGRALSSLLEGAGFRARYLLLAPSAALSHVDARARAALARTLETDPDPRLRAQAATVLSDRPDFLPELVRRLSDSEVRVREAAVRAFGPATVAGALQPLEARLHADSWPLVRRAAADALALAPSGAGVDDALAHSFDDDSPGVRARVALALGARGAGRYAPALRERLADPKERSEVQRAAAEALGDLCDAAAANTLTAYALKLADPAASPESRALAEAALSALVRVSPPDLARRLAPLLGPRAPALTRRVARALIARPGRRCAPAAPPSAGSGKS